MPCASAADAANGPLRVAAAPLRGPARHSVSTEEALVAARPPLPHCVSSDEALDAARPPLRPGGDGGGGSGDGRGAPGEGPGWGRQ